MYCVPAPPPIAVSKPVNEVFSPGSANVPELSHPTPFVPPAPTTIVFCPDKETPELYTRPPAPPPPPFESEPPPPPATIKTLAFSNTPLAGVHVYVVFELDVEGVPNVPQLYVPADVSENTCPAASAASFPMLGCVKLKIFCKLVPRYIMTLSPTDTVSELNPVFVSDVGNVDSAGVSLPTVPTLKLTGFALPPSCHFESDVSKYIRFSDLS